MPASPDQTLQLPSGLLGQLRPKILFSESRLHLLQTELPVLSVFGYYLVEQYAEGVDVRRFLRLENHIVFVL